MYEYEIKSINKVLFDFFKKEQNIDKFVDKDLETVAMSFWFSVREPFFYKKILFNQAVNLNKDQKDRHIRKKIEIFLHGNLK